MPCIPRAVAKLRPISVQNSWHCIFRFFLNSMLMAYLNMNLRRSQRKPMLKTIYEEKGAPSAAKDPKFTKKKRSYGVKNSARTYCDWATSENG
jgi:hypothetical protein